MRFLDLAYLHENYVQVGFGDVLRDVLQTFDKQARQNLQTIQTAYSTSDLNAVSEVAHTLKGSAGSVGALRLAAVAEALEKSAGNGDMAAATHLTSELTALTEGTLAEVAIILTQPLDDRWPTPW